MYNSKTLETIANGFMAASRIQSLYSESYQNRSENAVRPNSFNMLNQILQIIAEHSPEIHKYTINHILNRSNLYVNTYRNLKQHISSSRDEGVNLGNIVTTLGIIMPALANQHQGTVEKIIKIYEILNS